MMDRALQDEILGFLASRFPSSVSGTQLLNFCEPQEKLFANVRYLAERRFLNVSFSGTGLGMQIEFADITGLGIAEVEGFRR
jgi:hypothetical protein